MCRAFRLAVGQSPAGLSTTQARLDWLAGQLPDIAAAQTDLLLLPELFATGYNISDQVRARAEPSDGPIANTLSGLARQHGLAIHYGYPEEAEGVLYNAAQCFGPDGALLGGYRKRAIPPGFERDYFTAGQDAQLFTYRGVRIGTLICYDAEFPELVRQTTSLGAELVLVPTALGAQWEWVARQMIPTRAYENGVYLAYANSAGAENGLRFLGQSFVAAPDGQEIVRAQALPQIIYATLDPNKVTAAQKRLPYLVDRQAFMHDLN
ncbi:MAG: carbon-nitrogen hydrolase family protein [Roseobacter sp.]